MNNQRIKKAVRFGLGLAIGFAIFDWITLEQISLSRIIGSAIVGGSLYALILKIQGR